MITKKSDGILSHKRILVYLILSLLLCYLFTYHYNNEIRLDLGLVPFIIGSLYFRLSPILVFVSILLRIPYGLDFGFYCVTIGKGTTFEIMFGAYKTNNTGLDIIDNRELVIS